MKQDVNSAPCVTHSVDKYLILKTTDEMSSQILKAWNYVGEDVPIQEMAIVKVQKYMISPGWECNLDSEIKRYISLS